MDESVLWRRVLVNGLLEQAERLRAFSPLLDGVSRLDLGEMAHGHAELADAVLQHHPDPELELELRAAPLSRTAAEVVEQDAETVAEEGTSAAAESARAEEEKLLELVGDLEAELDPDLRSAVLSALHATIHHLNELLQNARSRESAAGSARTRDRPTRADDRQRVYEVWFGTNRAPIEAEGLVIGFSSETSAITSYGRCGVTIPRTHKIGENKPPWWRRYVSGERPLSVESISTLDQEAFWVDLRTKLLDGGTQPGDAIVFLHGYNVSFEEAALTAAQIGADLNLPGATAFFSWPSLGRLRGYFADEATIDASEQAVGKFLTDFVTQSGARRVHIIAHSMGNRALLRVVSKFADRLEQGAEKLFGQIILAAPDVDRRLFNQSCGAYPRVGCRTTLYVSSRDLAVRSSTFVHSSARIGFAPPVTVEPGIDTIDVGDVDLSFLGHGYVAGCRLVLTDVHQLLQSELEPGQRAGTRSRQSNGEPYWELAA